MKKQILALATILAVASSTFAAPQLRLSDGTTTITVTDGDANDQSTDTGVVYYNGPVGSKWTLDITIGITKPSEGSPAEPFMDLNTFNASTGAADLSIEYTDTDFTAASGAWDAAVGGTTDGNITFGYFLDSGNLPFGTNTPLTAFSVTAGAYNAESNGTFTITAPYSMTVSAKIHHAGRGTTGFDSSLILTPSTVQPPSVNCSGDVDLGCNPTTIPGCDTNSVSVTASCGVSNITCAAAGPDTVNGCVHERDLVYTVTDNCGQSATCTQHIYWTEDTVAPSFDTTPGDLALGCNPTVIPDCDLSQVQTSDNCGRAIVNCSKSDATNGCDYTRTITYVASDTCGNKATYVQHITWTVDTTAPSFTTCPSDINLGCNPTTIPDCDASKVVATDDCGTPTISCSKSDSADGCAHGRVITYVATDACGNTSSCVQRIAWTVNTTGPTFTQCPKDSDLGCNPSSVPACDVSQVSATAECGTPTITCSYDDSTSGCSKTRTITYLATDGCGNTATCVQHITWTDNTTAPTFTSCATDRNLGCNPLSVPTAEMASVSASSACSTARLSSSYVDSSNGCGRTRTITYVATDGCGNTASCVQQITWTVDTTAPTFTKNPANTDLGCNPSSIPGVNTASGNVAATDNCGTPSITGSYVDTSNNCNHTRTITYVATDACGNSSSKQQVITWTVDNTPPTFTSSPSDMTVTTCDANCAIATYTGSATDNCGSATVTFEPESGSCLPAGTNTVTATATDACGNTTVRTFTVVVQASLSCYVTYTPGGWFAPPNGNNAGQLLKNNFTKLYGSTGGVIVGGTKTIKFTSSAAVDAFPTGGGTPSYLTKSYINPTAATEAGEFAAQVISLKFNCDFSKAGIFKVGLVNLKVAPGYPLAGKKVSDVLVLANKVLGGTTSALPSGLTIPQLTLLLSGINGNYDGGLTNNGVLVP